MAKPKGTPKRPTPEMVKAIINACDDTTCDHAFCAPDDLEAVDRYSLKVTDSHMTHDGYSWTGIIYENGVAILDVENNGTGGPNRYYPTNGHDDDVLRGYIASAMVGFPRCKYEPEEALTCFLDMCFQNFNKK